MDKHGLIQLIKSSLPDMKMKEILQKICSQVFAERCSGKMVFNCSPVTSLKQQWTATSRIPTKTTSCLSPRFVNWRPVTYILAQTSLLRKYDPESFRKFSEQTTFRPTNDNAWKYIYRAWWTDVWQSDQLEYNSSGHVHLETFSPQILEEYLCQITVEPFTPSVP